MNRIVVTGMGIVSPLGCGVEAVWHRLLKGQSGLFAAPDSLVDGLSAKVIGQVPDIEAEPVCGFEVERYVDRKDVKKMDRFIQFAIAAAQEALQQSGWIADTEHKQARTATVIASGIGGFPAIANAVRTAEKRGVNKLSPFTIPSFLVNLAAGHVSIRHGFKGPIGAPVTACAAGIQAIGDAMRMIQSGEVDVAVCGGAEACLDKVSLGAFNAAKTMSSAFNDSPSEASRPFDKDRDGFVMGEGAGVLVIETLEHALARGATPVAELVGYATTADAYHITAGPESGEGARRAMENALAMATLTANDIQHINAHATSTPVGDRAEINAISSLFADSKQLWVTSTKSSTGHMLGAAGGVESIFTVLAVRDQVVPHTLNFQAMDVPFANPNVNIVQGEPKSAPIKYALCNGFGFGGVNACLIVKQYDKDN